MRLTAVGATSCDWRESVLHEMRRKKRKGIIMKLDFEKAYNKVSWSFLMEVLERKNFPLKWTE
jgi:hypothetical protein